MPKLYYSKRFNKSFKRLSKSGNFNDKKLEIVLQILEEGRKLEAHHKDHQLTGFMSQYRECHLESDLLLIYEVSQSGKYIEIVDIGSHSDIFE